MTSGYEVKDQIYFEDKNLLLFQIGYSITSAICGCMSQVLFNISMKYEDATKLSIYRSTDFVFTYLLQYFWLNISIDLYSCIGAGLIVFGTILIFLYKMVDKKISKNKKNILIKLIAFKF